MGVNRLVNGSVSASVEGEGGASAASAASSSLDQEENSTSGATSTVVTERVLDVLNSEEIKSAALNKLVREGNQGEVVGKEDLWGCLFGKPSTGAGAQTGAHAGVGAGTDAEAVVEAADAAVDGALAGEVVDGVEGLEGEQEGLRHEMRVRREEFLQQVEGGGQGAVE